MTRVLWSTMGVLALVVGGIGVVVPGLPTTVFFIIAAGCFSRSSPRLERWVLELPRIGPLVRDHRAGLGMPRRAKHLAIGSIVAFGSFGALVAGSAVIRLVIAAAMASGIAYVVRVPTREPDADRT